MDDYFDLFLWFDKNDSIIMFQLTYDKFHDPRTLTWKQTEGYSHEMVDDGDRTMKHKQSPILLPDGIFDYQSIAQRFKEASLEIPPTISNFIYTKIIHSFN